VHEFALVTAQVRLVVPPPFKVEGLALMLMLGPAAATDTVVD
jgi:hypothetical protein